MEMVKIEHTIFALPFAFMGAFMAAQDFRALHRSDGFCWQWSEHAVLRWRSIGWSTSVRCQEPAHGESSPAENGCSPAALWAFFVGVRLSSSIAASRLNLLALKLSPLALGIIFLYSYHKAIYMADAPFSGCIPGCSPIGAWIAIRGSSPVPVVLGSCGCSLGCGIRRYLFMSGRGIRQAGIALLDPQAVWGGGGIVDFGILHLLMLVILGFFFWREGLGIISLVRLGMVAMLLAYEHSLVRPADLSRANTAFFTINGWISVLLFVATASIWFSPSRSFADSIGFII